MPRYNQVTEEMMLAHYGLLSEPLRRQYAYIEAQKIGWGGIEYMSELLKISPKTIRKGGKEVRDSDFRAQIPEGYQRRKGGGRKKICPDT